jgi:hypothetical protein
MSEEAVFFVLRADHIKLVTPDGRELPVAPQEALLDDSAGIKAVVQNAQVWKHPVETYFYQRNRTEPLRFQVVPGQGIVSQESVVDNDRVAMGTLFFRIPAERWEAGTYRLAIDHAVVSAALPITLE